MQGTDQNEGRERSSAINEQQDESKFSDTIKGFATKAARKIKKSSQEAPSAIGKTAKSAIKLTGKAAKFVGTTTFSDIKRSIAESKIPIGNDWEIYKEATTKDFNKKKLGTDWKAYTRQKDGKSEVAFGIPRALFRDDAINKIDKYLNRQEEGSLDELTGSKSDVADALSLESQQLNALGALHREFLPLGGGFQIREAKDSYRKELIVKVPLADTYEEFERRVDKTLRSLGINDTGAIKEATKRLWKPPVFNFPEPDIPEQNFRLETDDRQTPEAPNRSQSTQTTQQQSDASTGAVDNISSQTDTATASSGAQTTTDTAVQTDIGNDASLQTEPETRSISIGTSTSGDTQTMTKTSMSDASTQTESQTQNISALTEPDTKGQQTQTAIGENTFDAPPTTEDISEADLLKRSTIPDQPDVGYSIRVDNTESEYDSGVEEDISPIQTADDVREAKTLTNPSRANKFFAPNIGQIQQQNAKNNELNKTENLAKLKLKDHLQDLKKALPGDQTALSKKIQEFINVNDQLIKTLELKIEDSSDKVHDQNKQKTQAYRQIAKPKALAYQQSAKPNLALDTGIINELKKLHSDCQTKMQNETDSARKLNLHNITGSIDGIFTQITKISALNKFFHGEEVGSEAKIDQNLGEKATKFGCELRENGFVACDRTGNFPPDKTQNQGPTR